MVSDKFKSAHDLILTESWFLDQREWDKWLDLYLPEAEYWLPCWKEDDTLTDDPRRQISLIYYSSRAGLEDRVYRIRTDRSLASTPLPRTSHIVNCMLSEVIDDQHVRISSNWVVNSYRLDQQNYFFGSQTHVLKSTPDGLKIASRKIIVMNDNIPCPLDIYSV